MKLHLPSFLRKALLAVLGAVAAAPAWSAIMHNSVTLLTYTDFGSNMGRYTIYQQNELLRHLNKDGVYITYTQGEKDYKLEHDMISYESMVDGGPFTAIAYNATATVQHNGVTNPVFTGRFIGSDKSIHYAGIEYRSCTENKFLLTPQIDYKITRLSKIITDITPSSVYDAAAHRKAGEDIGDMLQYRAGGGYMQRADESGKTTWLTGAYTYVVGGIVDNWSFGYSSGYDYETGTAAKTDGRGTPDDSYTLSIMGVKGWEPGTAGTETHPLPFVTQGGDSGSPVWVWNEASGAYELISCHQARGGYDSYSRGASEWTKLTLDSFCVKVDMDKGGHVVHIGEVQKTSKSTQIEAIVNGSTHACTITKYGKVTSDNGQVSEDFVGIMHGENTWRNLYALKDGQIVDDKGQTQNVNWYAYGNDYLNATNTEALGLQYADLFETQNLVFQSSSTSNSIVLDADVDLGIGYAQFSARGSSTGISYTISGRGEGSDRDFNFNHAGYIVDKGAEVHLLLANQEKEGERDYFREWRKVGDGDLYLEGTGDNHIFLNVGGLGTTYLKETDGYAAYNVIINNGATVNLGGDVNQVERDVTLGYGGGVLDFAAGEQSIAMDWYSTRPGEPANGSFTISAHTQDAIIANTSGITTLTYRADEDSTYLGSFWDGTIKDGDGTYARPAESGTLKVVYEAGDPKATWTLNSIHTRLSGDSGLEVKNGTVKLAGTIAEHAQGSLNGYNQQRYVNEDDWHYADAKMNVTVDAGATFELGSHARLTGTVTVEDGGTFLMREGVRHQMEYIEGWYYLEDTYAIADYYGLHGHVQLNGNAVMKVEFSDKTDANTTLKGNISGTGGMSIDTARGTLTLAGVNNFSGSKAVTNGILIIDEMASAGDVSLQKWKIGASAWLAVNGASAAEALKAVDMSSNGVLALSRDEDGDPLDLRGYNSLIIGAKDGQVIQFGTKDTETAFESVDGKWNLGGGGGNLVVNYALKDKGDLVLGNAFTEGKVTLTNKRNDIKDIHFEGKVTLDYDSIDALGDATVHLDYANRIMGSVMEGESTIAYLDSMSSGVMLLDKMGGEASIDLQGHAQLYLGVSKDTTYSGNFALGENGSYNFGGCTATLTLTQALVNQGEEGGTDLYIDAEGYSGGVVELQKALEITGIVHVMGRDYYREDIASGEITLRVDAENAFDSILGITLDEGGTLDINGYNQTLGAIYASAGSRIIDSSKDKSGTLYIASEFSSLDGLLDVGSLVIEAGGESHVYLGGESMYRDCTIRSGQVFLASSKSLSATGRTVLEEEASLTISNGTVSANLQLQGSTVTLGDLEMKENKAGNLGGTLTVAPNTTATINFAIDGSVLSAVVDTGNEGRLKLTGKIGTVSSPLVNAGGGEDGVSGAQVSGGNVDVELQELRLYGSGGSTIGGTLNLVGKDNRLTLSSWDARNNTVREIERAHINKGLNLTIQEQTWNTIWNIHELTGEGNITWNSSTIHWYSARMILDGENSFAGSLTAVRDFDDTSGRKYASYLELAHDKAAQFMDIDLQSRKTGNYMSLAINTQNAVVSSLSGDVHSVLYAGAAVEGAGNKNASIEVLQKAPSSTRQACLTVNTAEASTFSGNVYGAVEGDTSGSGLNLVMAGRGTQTFNGDTVQFKNVTVQSGTLVIDSNDLSIADCATIHGGATLGTNGKDFELVENMKLRVVGTSADTATLSSALHLAGGSLVFDAGSLSREHSALSINSLNNGSQSTLKVLFEMTTALHQDVEYKLVSNGDWSVITCQTENLDYYDAKFTTGDGLSVTFNLKTDNNIWMGTEQKTSWDNSNFGVSAAVPGEGKTAVFNDLAESQSVQVQGDQAAARLLFDATKDYTVGGSGDASLSADSLLQTGNGTTKLGSGVSIEGMADMRAGTLVMQEGSSIGSATVAEAATLRLESAEALSSAGTVEGRGNVQVAWDEGRVGSLHTAEDGIGSLSVESGMLKVTDALTVHREIVVGKDAALQSTTGSILGKESTAELHLGGTLKLEIASHQDMTDNVVAVTGEDGQELKGRIEKSGSANLTVKNSVVADTILVSGGTLTVADDSVVADFLNNVDTVEVASGARFVVGRGNYTVQDDGFATNLKVSGNGSNLELSVAQHTSKTFEGTVSVTDGGKLSKYDGGVVLTGNATLGSGEGDKVTLSGNWGKSGMQFVGLVEGDGTVNLNSVGYGGSTERFAFSNDGNTFQGKFDVNNRTRLVAGSDKALQYADVDLKNGGGLLVAADNAHINNLNGVAGSVIELDNGRTEGTLTVNQAVAGEYAGSLRGGVSLTKDGVADLTLSGDNSAFNGKLSVQEGTLHVQNTAGISGMEIAGGATLDLGGDTRISARGGQGLGSGSFLMQTGEAGSSISGGDGAAARLENAAVDLANGTRLEMENITLAASASVSDASRQATLAAKSLRIEAQVGDNLVSASSVSARMQPLTYGLDMPQPRLAAAAADEVVSYTLANVSGVSLAGDSLMISLVDGVSAWNGADWMAVSLADGGTFSEALSVTMLFTDAEGQAMAVQGVYTLDDAALAAEAEQPHNHVYFRLSGAAQVPEPTTGALSLLALAALAARRRRK